MAHILNLFRRYPLTLLCIAAIWYLCLIKPPSISLLQMKNSDKVAHCLMYLGTCCVMWGEYWHTHVKPSTLRLILWIVIAPVCMSGLVELAQAYLTGGTRSGDWKDFAANTIGVLLAVPIGLYGIRRLFHIKTPQS